MSRARKGKLTDAFVSALTPHPDGRERIVRDGVVRGFLIRVGKRKKRFELRIEKPPKHTINLGEWHKHGDADMARTKALELWKMHDAGKPIEEPTRDDMPTLETEWPTYAAWIKTEKNAAESTIEHYEYSFNRLSEDVRRRALSELGSQPKIFLAEYERIKVAHGISAARATARLVRAVFRNARADDPLALPGNPIGKINTANPESEQPKLTTKELPGWWQQVRDLSLLQREAHVFALLSGLRISDVCELEWKNLKVKGSYIHIPKPKGGTKKAFDLVLSRPMLRCLWRAKKAGAMLHPVLAETWVFPSGESDTGHITRRATEGIAHGHALRRTYSTLAFEEVGIDEAVIRRLLNHRAKGVTGKYIAASNAGKHTKACQEDIGDFLVAALDAGRALNRVPKLDAKPRAPTEPAGALFGMAR